MGAETMCNRSTHTSTTSANASTNAFYSDANASQSNTIRRLSRRFHGRVFGFVFRRRERIQSVRQRMRCPLRKSRCGCSVSNHLLMHIDIERYLSSRSFHFVHFSIQRFEFIHTLFTSKKKKKKKKKKNSSGLIPLL